MALIRTFVRVLDPGPPAEVLLDDLAVRLHGRAVLGRTGLGGRRAPVVFFDDTPVEEQHTTVIAALDAIDRTYEDAAQLEWAMYLAVEDAQP